MLGVRLGRHPLGHRAGGLAQRDRLPGDVGRQHPQDLAERRADGVVGVGDRVLGVERRHHQAERLGRGEDQRRQPQPAPQPVAAVGTARRLHRDVGLAQDRDVAPRGPLGDAEALGELGGGDPGAALEDVQRPQRPRGRADLAHPGSPRRLRWGAQRTCRGRAGLARARAGGQRAYGHRDLAHRGDAVRERHRDRRRRSRQRRGPLCGGNPGFLFDDAINRYASRLQETSTTAVTDIIDHRSGPGCLGHPAAPSRRRRHGGRAGPLVEAAVSRP